MAQSHLQNCIFDMSNYTEYYGGGTNWDVKRSDSGRYSAMFCR